MVQYSDFLFAKVCMELRGMNSDGTTGVRPPAWDVLGKSIRHFVIAFVLAHSVLRLGVGDLG